MTAERAEAVFAGGLRTAFGRAHKGALKDARPDDLLAWLLNQHSRLNSGLWNHRPEDVIAGCGYPEGEQGYNVARMAALGAGLAAPGLTVNRLCGSSLEAAAIAAARIRAGFQECVLVGGIESMSRVPRRGANFSESEAVRGRSPQAYVNMGDTAEEVAARYPRVSRAEQEEFAARSHELAHRAYEAGHYADHVLPFAGLARDELVRWPADRAKMAELKPAFREGGIVTAATSSPLTDGATSGWVLSRPLAARLGVKDALLVRDVAWSHVEPEVMGLGPVPAIQAIFRRNGLKARDVAAYEINEAFAVQVLACARELDLPMDRLNAWGGAIAVGHPLGASGLRLMMTLHGRLRLAAKPGALGIAALCIGGGQGMGVLVEWVR